MVTKFVSSQTLEIIIPSRQPKKEINKLLVLIEINKYEMFKMKIFYFERICVMR